MSGWGNKDKKSANTGTVAITAVTAGGGGGVVTGTGTLFDDELKVGEYVFVVSESLTYIVTSIASNTSAVFRAGEPGNPAIVAVTGANTFYITQKPKFASFGGAAAGTATADVYGVSDQEVGKGDKGTIPYGSNGIGAAHAGWNRRVAKTDSNSVARVLWETLVVQSARATTRAAMGDAPDDTVLPGSGSVSPSASRSPSSSVSASISPSASRSPSSSASSSASLSRSPSASVSPSASASESN